METLFMGPIDNGAATAHARMLDGGVDQLTDQQRSDWGRFIMSLWFRTPTDVQHLWDALSTLADPVVGPGLLGLEIPEPLPPIAIKQLQMEVLRNVIDHKERGETLINMEWSVLQADHALEFWISDWPMDLPSSAPWLGSVTSYVTVPISPNRLFIAAGSRKLLDRIGALPDRTLIIRQNRATVRHALNFVGATNGLGADYIRANFGIFERPSIVAGIAKRYREQIPVSA